MRTWLLLVLLLICYLMNGIKSLFTSGNTLAFIVFCVVLAVVALLVGLACKNVTVGSAVFCGGAVVLVLLFKLRPAWLLTGFNSVLARWHCSSRLSVLWAACSA